MSGASNTPSVLLAAMYQRLVEVDGWKWQANYEAVARGLRVEDDLCGWCGGSKIEPGTNPPPTIGCTQCAGSGSEQTRKVLGDGGF